MDLTKEEKYIIARFTYRMGSPILSDPQYDKLEREIKDEGLLPEYTSRTYDDDPIPYDLVNKLNLNHLLDDLMTVSKYSSFIDSTKSLSIQPVTDKLEVWGFVQDQLNQTEHNCDFNLSLKMDGVNSKALYINGKLEICVSRGRGGNGIDYTKCAINVLPLEIDTDEKNVIIYTEAFVPEACLPYLRNKYKKEYKTPKSAAITMLRVPHDKEDYRFLQMVGIDVEGPDFKTKTDKYTYLKKLGFKIAPNIAIPCSMVDVKYEEFRRVIDKCCDLFYEKTKGMPSDGLVLEVNDQTLDYAVSNQYCAKNIALKLNQWEFSVYNAIVEDIVVEQQRVNASLRLKIKTVKTDDLCDATWVNGYNPDIIISNGIKIGSKIQFERNSGAINCLVY